MVRENDTGYLPPLKTKLAQIHQYDVVVVGFPTWAMQLPPPMKSFLRQYDLRGKIVVPFNTNGGYGVGSAVQTLTQLCTGCTVAEAFITRGGVERDGQLLVIQGARAAATRAEVEGWLRTLDQTISPHPVR